MPVAPGLPRLRLIDAHTGGTFDGAYRDANGPIPRVMDELCVFLRDQHSGRMTSIDVGVIDFLANVMAATGQTSAVILSAYRTPETNAMLARTTFGVAENSQHLYGRALDVRFPTRLADAMAAARAMRRGGVGWYPHSGFIHLDTGPVRNWDLENEGLQDLLITLARSTVCPERQGRDVVQWARHPDHRRRQTFGHIAWEAFGLVAAPGRFVPSIGEGGDNGAVTVAHGSEGDASDEVLTTALRQLIIIGRAMPRISGIAGSGRTSSLPASHGAIRVFPARSGERARNRSRIGICRCARRRGRRTS